MESASKNTSNTEDLLSVILTHIKQNNGNVKDLLEGPHLKNNEDLEKCISSLILLIHDLSRTFCDELSRATESLQSTFHLLKGIQNKFKDFDSNNEEIQYIASINQVLGDTAKNLKVAEEKLNIISEQYKSDKEKKSNVSNHINEEDVIDGKMITPSARSDNAREKIEKVEQSDKSNKPHDEVNTLTIMNGSAIAKANHASSEDIFHQEVNSKKSTGYSSENKKHEETNAERHMDAKQPSNNIHQTEYSSTAKPAKETNKELHLNGKIPNLSKEDMLESKAWDKETYKEYILETDNEQRSSCFIKAPAYVLEQLQCQLMDDISSLLVSESEELVSNVLGLWSKDPDLKIPFPLSISIPFNSRYRGNYKDVMVKANDEKLHASYLTPNSLDGYHGTHKGSFAEIKVYKLGIYAVVSCLRKENFTIPKKGLSVKLSMDSRISLNYPPGCFNTSVIVQFKVQPIDTSLISLLKVKQDIYHSVVSSSPLVHVKQPSIHCFHKNITVILPCPPNPEKKKQAEDTENKRASTATASRIAQAHQIRAVSASVRKPGDNPTELLKLIAFKEDQWIILDDVVVKNIQNGIVLFEVAEHLQSFTVIRLSSPMDNSHLLSFIQNLQDAIHSSMVNVVLYRRKDNPQKAVVQLIPSKELNWEVLNLRDAGYTGPPEPSEQIPLQEGEQIHLRFCGNISASDGKSLGKSFKLTFHSQRKQQRSLNLAVVDEFGNHSSPHYKGTVAIYKISKDDIMESYKRGIESEELLQQRAPLCKLALTLPKMEKNISRPSSTKLSSSEPTDIFWDNLLQWLAQELSEEDTSLLVLSLPIRRSTIQLVKLKSPDNLTEQIFELLTFWKKSLPTSADKLRLLARHLRKIGREDLVEGLQKKSEEKAASMQT